MTVLRFLGFIVVVSHLISDKENAAGEPQQQPQPRLLRSESKRPARFSRHLEKRSFTSVSVISNLSSYISVTHKAKWTKYVGEWKTFVTLSKEFMLVLLAALLRESYLVSLVGLYVCGLTKVNLLNAGYRMPSFFIFFSQFNVASFCSYIFYRFHHQSRNSYEVLGRTCHLCAVRFSNIVCMAT